MQIYNELRKLAKASLPRQLARAITTVNAHCFSLFSNLVRRARTRPKARLTYKMNLKTPWPCVQGCVMEGYEATFFLWTHVPRRWKVMFSTGDVQGVWTIMNMVVWQRLLRENKRNVQSHFACPVLLMALILPWAQQVSAKTYKQVFQVKYLCCTQTHTNAVNDNTQLNISFWEWLNPPNAQVVGKWRNWSIL